MMKPPQDPTEAALWGTTFALTRDRLTRDEGGDWEVIVALASEEAGHALEEWRDHIT